MPSERRTPPAIRVAAVGHVEWIEFARVERVPAAGEIVHATDAWEEPGGGGAVVAVQLGKLAPGATFYTALGDDGLGRRAFDELSAHGLKVEAVFREVSQRRAFTFVDGAGERTITVMGERLGPRRRDPLPWDELSRFDAVYFTAGDAAALQAARAARVLVGSARVLETIAEAGVELDVLVGSGTDQGERYEPGDLDPPPRIAVATASGRGGAYVTADGKTGSYAAAPLPGPVVDAYGAGDSFAAGLTFGIGAGYPIDDALAVAARCGAACLTGRGPYTGQLELAR
jgi:ribokinase